MKIKVTLDIPEERLSDLLCSALEGGSNYWYCIKDAIYPEGKTKNDYEFWHIEVPFDEGGALVIEDIEGDMPDKILDLKSMKKGIRTMARKYPRHFGDFIDENDDAITADVFLQCCLYGETIYG